MRPSYRSRLCPLPPPAWRRPRSDWRRLFWPAALGLLIPALTVLTPLQSQAQPVAQPPPPPLNPAWAFDPNGPLLPGTPAPGLLLPGGGGAFNPGQANQPLAISNQRPRLIPPCPLIVPAKDVALQPLHIPPAMVPYKNRFGCLSPADAVYGPDGCPRRLCGEKQANTIALPPGGP